MATITSVRSVVNIDTGAVYKLTVDWTDNGDGTVSVVAGSDLETAQGAGDSIKVNTDSFDI